MTSVLENGLINSEDCKLLDTQCLDAPMYLPLVRRLHLGISSMTHEAKCIQLFSVVDNLLTQRLCSFFNC